MTEHTEPTEHPEMLWSGWGDPAEAVTLTESTLGLLQAALQVRQPMPPAAGVEAVTLPAAQLSDGVRARIEEIGGAEHVLTDDARRGLRPRGKSTPDLLR